MGIWTLIRLWWQARMRRIDLELLWPICVKGAPDLDRAKAAFAYHAMTDPNWLALGEEGIDIINNLQPPVERKQLLWKGKGEE